uniref:replicative DNA helicase n=1 Tax=Paractinoplanes polyasparticus TaxID=2856853 RepID=UPI001C85042A|nr:replicative DNA helicase [Actinoplanes polyasparticus]
MTGELKRTPPHSLDAERIVLGCMMTSAEASESAEEILKPGDFYRPAHELIFTALVDQRAKGHPTDPVALAEHFLNLGQITRVGGLGYLTDCYAAVPFAAGVGHYADIVARKAMLRRLGLLADKVSHGVYGETPADPGDLMDFVREALAGVEDALAQDGGPRRWAAVLPDVLDAVSKAEADTGTLPGVPTGLDDLDRLLGGWLPGQLIVVAARTGVGKSVATTGFAVNAAFRKGIPAAVFSMEMRDVEIGTRILASEARVSLHQLKSGLVEGEGWKRIKELANDGDKHPLFIDDSPNMTLADIRSRARKLHRQHGLRLLVVDYLQLIETARAENRQNAIAAVSRGLKLLAMELAIPVIAVSQLNRGPENRPNKRPTKSDLRESGAIENDADVIVLIHRDDYYDPESPRAGEADFIVDKNRAGATDTITVAAQLHLSKFADMTIA